MNQLCTGNRLDRCIDAIYDASISPQGWPSALAEIQALFNASFADICSWTPDRMYVSGTAVGLDDDDYRDQLLGFWFNRNVWGRKSPVRLAGEVLSTRQMMPREELRRSEMYNEYLESRGLHEGMRITLWVEPDGLADLSILRPWSMGAFGPNEVELGQKLLPHLQRAAKITRQLSQAKGYGDPWDACPTASLAGVIAFDRNGIPIYCNDAARNALSSDLGLWLDDFGLRAASPDVSRQLRLSVSRAIRRDAVPGVASAVSVPRRDSPSTITVLVQSVSGLQDWTTPRPPAAVAIFKDPSRGLSPEFLQRIFGLTAMEARLTLDLMAGSNLQDLASRTDRSRNTLRSHLASVMGKTGTTRQIDLMRLLNSLEGLDGSGGQEQRRSSRVARKPRKVTSVAACHDAPF